MGLWKPKKPSAEKKSKLPRLFARFRRKPTPDQIQGGLGKPERIEQLFSRYRTDESRQYMAEYPNGQKYFLRVPFKQKMKPVVDTFFLRSALNVLLPENSVRQVSIDLFDVNGKKVMGTLSVSLKEMSADYHRFFDDYYGQAHGRSNRDPSRIRFFQQIQQYNHPAFVDRIAKPLSGEIFWKTGLALDTKGPVNVGNVNGRPVFFEVFRVGRTLKHYSTDRMLRDAFKREGITRKTMERYWKDVPENFRQELLQLFDKITK